MFQHCANQGTVDQAVSYILSQPDGQYGRHITIDLTNTSYSPLNNAVVLAVMTVEETLCCGRLRYLKGMRMSLEEGSLRILETSVLR
jgi:hypothetical protein